MLHRSPIYTLLVFFATTFIPSLTPDVFSGDVNLNWNLNSDPDIKGYNLYFGTQSEVYDAPNSPIFVPHPTTNLTITGLQNNQQYFFTITALDFSDNQSPPSGEVTTVVSEDLSPSDTTPPTVPTIHSVVAGSHTNVTITWSSATDNVAVTSYILYRDGQSLITTSNTTYTDTNLTADTTYTYTVMAQDLAGNSSAQSTDAKITTPVQADTTPPSTPEIHSAVVNSSTQATLTWSAATDNVAVTGYTLYRNKDPLTTTPTLSFLDTTLSPASTYAYFVVAHDAMDNQSGSSATISLRTLPPPDTTMPTVGISSPSMGDTLTGPAVVLATATDNVGVIGVQFQLDGVNLGAEDTTNTYSVDWDTSSLTPGSHTLTAIARDEAGNTSTSTPVTITIDTQLPTAPLINQAGWTLLYVDSEELVGENGAAVHAFDGDASTIWHTKWVGTSPGHSHDLILDLGALYSMEGFRALPRQGGSANGRIGQYELYVKTDSGVAPTTPPVVEEWMPVATGRFPNTPVEQEVLFTTHTSRYVWLRAIDEAQGVGNPWTSLAELNLLRSITMVTTPAHDDTTPPSTPEINSAVVDSSTQATLTWSAATDNVAVTGYTLYRDNQPLTTTPTLSFVDTTLSPASTYAYFMVAHDTMDNQSGSSRTISVTTPPLSDTTMPTVSISSPAAGDTVTGPVVVLATAADNVGVMGVQFQLDGVNLGLEDTTNAYSVSWDTSAMPPGPYALTAIARDAAGNFITSLPTTITVVEADAPLSLAVTNLQVQSGQTYGIVPNGLESGAQTYIDRTYTFTTFPSTLTNVTYIQTANNDKNSTGPSFLSFNVNQPVTVFVAHDDRITSKPAWLGSFTTTLETLSTTDTNFTVFSQTFPPGTVTLGGNDINTTGLDLSMYAVAVVSEDLSLSDTTQPTVPPAH